MEGKPKMKTAWEKMKEIISTHQFIYSNNDTHAQLPIILQSCDPRCLYGLIIK